MSVEANVGWILAAKLSVFS